MIKEIKTEKFEGLAVLVPPYGTAHVLDLKQYKILGKAKELTEEQCADIMPKPVPLVDTDGNQTGSNYLSGSAKSDFNNLLHYIHGCYSINPYEKFKGAKLVHAQGSVPTAEMIIEEVNRKYDEAQKHTGTWLILKKISS
jgi:hypothetical protein